ncbi:MAG: 30S ribosome-binding factor RbfA [Burkholderiales bacterium]
MPRDHPRARRVSEQILRELADLLRLEVKDPRVGMVTLTEVEVSRDLSHAKVYFTLLGDAERVAESTAGLAHAAGFLRSELSHRLQLRTVPELHFAHDASVERGIRLSQLIDRAVAADSTLAAQAATPPPRRRRGKS